MDAHTLRIRDLRRVQGGVQGEVNKSDLPCVTKHYIHFLAGSRFYVLC